MKSVTAEVYYFLSLSTEYSMKVLELYVVFSLLSRCSQFPSVAGAVLAASQSHPDGGESWCDCSPSRPCT